MAGVQAAAEEVGRGRRGGTSGKTRRERIDRRVTPRCSDGVVRKKERNGLLRFELVNLRITRNVITRATPDARTTSGLLWMDS